MSVHVAQQNVDMGLKKFNLHAQMEHIQSKYTGCGGPDTTKWEWMTTVHRDSHASHASRFNRCALFSVIENESIARVRYNQIQAMIQPCGKPPERRM
ncbi:unnamed protein product [Amoebophrya sp. A120]|nr:unnamed protein product [Amoebophrya sp. A120]|eukprot:GSA120T00012594001.1